MVESRHCAVYNSRIFYMVTSRSSSLRSALPMLAVFILCIHSMAWASDWETAEQQIAAEIFAVTGTGPATIEVSNRSSLGQSDADEIRGELINRLSALGLKWAAADSAPVSIQVSLSENVQQYVWVAQIRKGASEPAIVMVSRPRANIAGPGRDTSAMTLRKTLLWSSDTQILSTILLDGPPQRMAVLYPKQIQFYRFENDHWVEEQAFIVTHSRPWPRDLRGRLVLAKDGSVQAYLPGVACQSSVGGTPSGYCREANDLWPIGTDQSSLHAFFAQSRNFFTGALSPGIGKQSTVPPFYSGAPVPNERGPLWLLAAVDGRIHMLDGTNDIVAGRLNWGSDLAAVHSSCGLRWQVLATSSGTGNEDTLRAYEIPGREPVAVGQAVSFSGKITSLWPAPNNNGAVAVSRSSETGKYEAYLLTMACSQ